MNHCLGIKTLPKFLMLTDFHLDLGFQAISVFVGHFATVRFNACDGENGRALKRAQLMHKQTLRENVRNSFFSHHPSNHGSKSYPVVTAIIHIPQALNCSPKVKGHHAWPNDQKYP